MATKKGRIQDYLGDILHPETQASQVLFGNSNVETTLNNKANSAHGNHVPETQIINNSVFLRNDNTWQRVTPDNIGALPATSNAVSASKLQTVRTINGVGFDGTANITIADSTKLPLSGGTLTGDVIFSQDSTLSWSRNTDSAKIRFKNTGDDDTDSYMQFSTSDNGNEYFKFDLLSTGGATTTELMTIKSDHLRYKGNAVYHVGNKPVKADVGLGNVDNESKATMFTNPVFTGSTITSTAPMITIQNTSGNDVALTLDRGSNSSWKLLNSSGNLYLQNNYTTVKGDYFNVISLSYSSGNASFKGSISAPSVTATTFNGKLATPNNSAGIVVGDDAYIGDINLGNMVGIWGQSDATTGGIVFGNGKDTNLYRGGANLLRTNNSLVVDGNIGIGTTTPSAKLDVIGDIKTSTGINVANKFKMQYNSTEDSLDFIYG